MSNLSDLLPAGGGQNAEKFVASGTLASGQTVVLKADGTVEAVGFSSTTFTENVGTETQFQNGNPEFASAVFHVASGKVVVAYRDQSNLGYGKAVVGTVSGDTISFGTPVTFLADTANWTSACYDSVNEKVVVFYTTGTTGYAIVGTVSGTSISFGSAVTYSTQNPAFTGASFDTSAGKCVVAYSPQSTNGYGTARVGTVSGTSISFGSEVVWRSDNSAYPVPVYDTNANKTVILYRENSIAGHGEAIVGTISGTSMSFGSAVQFDSSPVTVIHGAYDSLTNQIICVYTKVDAKVVLGTVSGTSISFGAIATAPSSAGSGFNSVAYDSSVNKIVLVYSGGYDPTYSLGTIVLGTVSGTSVTFGTEQTFNTTTVTEHQSAVYDSTNRKVVVAYGENNASGEALVYQAAGTASVSNLSTTTFIGITAEAISNAATGAVNVYGGINEAQSGLTIASDYYVQDDGSLAAGVESIAYDISGATYTQSFSVSAQETNPRQIAFNADGTKMFIVGQNGQDVSEYTLSTGFDVSTSAFVDAFDVSPQDIYPQGLAFSTDGTKMFVVGIVGVDVNEYTLSTGFDVSTASFVDSFSISAQGADPKNIAFNTDGTKMFIVELAGQDVNEYTLSSGFDVSTASFVDSFSVASEETQPHGITFNADGTVMFIVGFTGDDVNKYNLSTGFDVSTASFSNITFSVAAEETQPNTIAFSADGSIMFVLGGAGQDVDQYAVTQTTFATTVLAGQAISATTINMRNLT